MFCSNCGSRLEDDAFFCTQCGMRIQREEFVSAAPESFAYIDPSVEAEQPAEQADQWQPTEEQAQPDPDATQIFDHVQMMEAAKDLRDQAQEPGYEAAAAAQDALQTADSVQSIEQQAIENFEQQTVQNQDMFDEPQNVFQTYDQQWNQWQQPEDQQWNQWQQPADQQWNQWQQPADQQWNQWQQPADQQYAQWQQPADQQWNQWQQPAAQADQGYGYAKTGYGQGYAQTQPSRGRKEKRSKAPLFIILGVVLLALAAVAVWWFFLRNQKSDIALSKYISADFTGVDGFGSINAYLDYDELQKDIWTAMGHETADMDDVKSQKDLALVYQFTGQLYASISQKDGLSNGDKVKVSIDVPQDIPDELCIRVTDSEKEFTVEGLQAVQSFDPFGGIAVIFEGMDPFVKADYERIKTDDLYYYVDFSLDKTTGLSSGDTVTVTATYNEEYLREMGYRVTADTQTYTVVSDGAYILDASQLSQALLDQLDTQSKQLQQEQAAGWIDVAKLEDMSYIGYAFVADPEFDPDYDTKSNNLLLIYNVYISTDDGPLLLYEWFGYENIEQDAQGNQYAGYDSVYQVSDFGVDSRVWTANQKYYITGFGTIDEMKAFLDNYYSGAGTVFYDIHDIPEREVEWADPTAQVGHLTNDPNGYIFPNSNTEYLDEAFLRTLTDQELQYARNEIVARYGRKFKTEEIAAYFGAKTWYVPTYEPEEFDKKMDSMINAFEKANITLINKIEAERAAQKKQ